MMFINITISISENGINYNVISSQNKIQNTNVLATTAKLTKWRPRRDHDGKHVRQELSCTCLLMRIYFW